MILRIHRLFTEGRVTMFKTPTDSKSSSLPGSAAIQPYLKEIQETPLLTAQEEKQLAQKVAQGDPSARDLMIRANLRLVVKVARHYLGRGVALEDLIEEGNLGLMRAVESFDPDAETRFSTYAVYWIKQSMRRSVMNQGRPIRLPAYLVNLMIKWHRATAILTERLGRSPTDDEVCAALKLSTRKSKIAVWALKVTRAMPSNQESNSPLEFTLEEFVSDYRSRPVDMQLHDLECMERIQKGMQLLDPLEAEWIECRFGLGGDDPMRLNEAAQKLGLPRQRAKIIEKQALNRLTRLSKQPMH